MDNWTPGGANSLFDLRLDSSEIARLYAAELAALRARTIADIIIIKNFQNHTRAGAEPRHSQPELIAMAPHKTDPELLELIERSKSHAMTPEEIYEQRRSFVRGMCPSNRDYADWCKDVDRIIPPMTLPSDSKDMVALAERLHAYVLHNYTNVTTGHDRTKFERDIASMIEGIKAELRCATPSHEGREAIAFGYVNWRGETSHRRVQPISIRYGKSKWHPREGWLMRGLDLDKSEEREFAMKDMLLIEPANAILSLAPPSVSVVGALEEAGCPNPGHTNEYLTVKKCVERHRCVCKAKAALASQSIRTGDTG